MKGPYWEPHEKEYIEELTKHDDTISCWIATRINGASASMACDGNINIALLKKMDKQLRPIFKNERAPFIVDADKALNQNLLAKQNYAKELIRKAKEKSKHYMGLSMYPNDAGLKLSKEGFDIGYQACLNEIEQLIST